MTKNVEKYCRPGFEFLANIKIGVARYPAKRYRTTPFENPATLAENGVTILIGYERLDFVYIGFAVGRIGYVLVDNRFCRLAPSGTFIVRQRNNFVA